MIPPRRASQLQPDLASLPYDFRVCHPFSVELYSIATYAHRAKFYCRLLWINTIVSSSFRASLLYTSENFIIVPGSTPKDQTETWNYRIMFNAFCVIRYYWSQQQILFWRFNCLGMEAPVDHTKGHGSIGSFYALPLISRQLEKLRPCPGPPVPKGEYDKVVSQKAATLEGIIPFCAVFQGKMSPWLLEIKR